jgi:Peptidase family M23
VTDLAARGDRDWSGWVWPVPRWQGRTPVITQEWKPGRDPVPGTPSSERANHLGVDIMFRKLPTDPPGNVLHDAEGSFIAPAGVPILAAGPGKIWARGEEPYYGKWLQVDHGDVVTFYQHLASYDREWRKGDRVEAGDVVGRMGYAPGDPQALRHLHFELWWPRKGEPFDSWRQDPRPHMDRWSVVDVGQGRSVVDQGRSLGLSTPAIIGLGAGLVGLLALGLWAAAAHNETA